MQRVPPFSYSIFIVRYKTGRDYRVPLWSFFRHCATFFRNFLFPKGPPSSFLIFYCKMKFQKAQRVSPFKFFGTMRLAQNSYFSIFRFFLEYFFNFSKGSPSFFKIFCNIIDIKQSQGSPILDFSALWDWLKILIFRFFFFFQKTQRVPLFTISKSLSFLSLEYGADLRRSRLVSSWYCSLLFNR